MDKSGHKKSLLRKMLEGKQKKKSLSAPNGILSCSLVEAEEKYDLTSILFCHN